MEQTLGKRIAANRKRLGMTQDALAEKLGVTAQAVSKWENDQSCPDITILPKLAEIFGTTTDALLGVTEEPVHEGTVEPKEKAVEDNGFQVRKGGWEFKYENSRRGGLFFAAFVLLVGAMYLVNSILGLGIGLWNIVWPSALLVWGIQAQRPRFSFFGLGCIIFGGFFLVNHFIPVKFQLGGGVVVSIIILLLGGSLLMDALGKPRKPVVEFTYNGGNGSKTPQHDFCVDGEKFQFNASFGEQYQAIEMARLSRGEVNTSFGEYTLDLSGIGEVAESCRLEANASFGELTIRVPARYQVRCASSAAFASVETEGHPDPEPAGIIHLNANASFGQITVKYI